MKSWLGVLGGLFLWFALLLFGASCAAPRPVPAPSPARLPPGTSLEANGAMIGPQGGRLERVDGYFLETVVLSTGEVRLFAYDVNGALIPASQLQLSALGLRTQRGYVDVALWPADPLFWAGYCDPFFCGPGAWGAGWWGSPWAVDYPTTIVIQNRPVRPVRDQRPPQRTPTVFGTPRPTPSLDRYPGATARPGGAPAARPAPSGYRGGTAR